MVVGPKDVGSELKLKNEEEEELAKKIIDFADTELKKQCPGGDKYEVVLFFNERKTKERITADLMSFIIAQYMKKNEWYRISWDFTKLTLTFVPP